MNENMRDEKGRFVKGHFSKDEWKEKSRKANLGKKAWNAGLNKNTDKRVKESAKKNAKIKKKQAKKGEIKGLFNKKGINLKKDKEREATQYKKGCIRLEMRGDKNPMRNKKTLKKNLGKRGKSRLEEEYVDLFKKLKYDIDYVGDGKFFVGDKCPDFINKNKKIAIEVYCRKHKDYFRGGCKKWEIERKKYFNDLGWNIIFFDETQKKLKIIKEELDEIFK